MFKILNKIGAIPQHQMQKEVSKVSARTILKEKSGEETVKASDPWWKARVDWQAAAKNAAKYRKDYERTLPETLSSQAQNSMWKRAKQLKDEFIVGMLSKEELHPVKQFSENGTIKAVIDEDRIRANRSVEREMAWSKHNEAKIREFKNLMRHLEPDDPKAGDVERFRPKMRGIH